MDKNAIKKYAVWARNELIARVTQKAQQYGITETDIIDANADSINGKLLTDIEKKQRQALIKKINEENFEQVMEEVAYTWFNRFTALRFMEVNNYLPSHTRVFTNEANEFKPQILADAISLDLEGLDMDKVYELKDANKNEELYKYLLIVQCNALNNILPRMFQKIADYTELLLPDYLLREGSVVEQLVQSIPEDDWHDQVQVLGWLYQYYNSEPKDKVFAALKNNVKISKENIPAATQLFTPDWVVRYMVENTIGHAWLEGHPTEQLKELWDYYIENPNQEEDVKKVLNELTKKSEKMTPEEIRCIDPCMGSGHILVYIFDILIQIYESYGYTAREAVENIVSKNLWGLDIDERAAQLTYFAIMMKARQYDRRFFSHVVQPHVYVMVESNLIDKGTIDYFSGNNSKIKTSLERLIDSMHDAREYGSLTRVENINFELLNNRMKELENEVSMMSILVNTEIAPILKVGKVLSQKYDVVCTNPPYMEISSGSSKLVNFVNKNFIGGKTDMFAVFIERAAELAKENGFVGMITQPSLTSLVSFERLRNKLFTEKTFYSFLHMGRGIFGIDFGSVAFVYRNSHIKDFNAKYYRLYDRTFQYIDAEDIKQLFLNAKNNPDFKVNFENYDTESGIENMEDENGLQLSFNAKQDKFMLVPGIPFAYTMSEQMINAYQNGLLGDIFVTREGMATAGNDIFLRMWYELDIDDIAFNCCDANEAIQTQKKWFPYNKGGDYRKWYGNNDYVVDWENDGYRIRNNKDKKTGRTRSHNYNGEYAFRKGLTWSSISAGDISIRWSDEGFLFDSKGAKGFCNDENKLYTIQAFLNSTTAMRYLKVISPTMDFKVGDIIQLPLNTSIFDNSRLPELVKANIDLMRKQSYLNETSWEFVGNFLNRNTNMEEAVNQFIEEQYQARCELKTNEEEINRIIANIYNLEDTKINVSEDKLSIPLYEPIDVVKSFISYFVGCLFGRYGLQNKGIITSDDKCEDIYDGFVPDPDNIVPICDDEYFNDDIVHKFVEFLGVYFNKEDLEINLSYIAGIIGGKGSSRECIRNYFINSFFTEHCDRYSITGSGKRPIYWLFDSGKKNGFKCLVYMHKYRQDTIARIRTDYIHEQQSRYRTEIENIEQRLSSASSSERVKLTKQLKKISEQAEELRLYEEKVHHLADQMISINLDDGVKINYDKFKDVLAKIK